MSGSAPSGAIRPGVVVGKTSSFAAMALTVGSCLWPGQTHAVAVVVVALTAVNYAGVQKAAWLTRVIVAVVLMVLAAVVTTCLVSGSAGAHHLDIGPDGTFGGVPPWARRSATRRAPFPARS